MAGPLDGITVVELGVWVAGPAAGGILADWGADVVKVEPPAGDPARMFGRMLGCDMGVNPPFEMDNRSKRSIVLNLTDDADRESALELLDAADVFVTNV
ncbi:MAG: CoA transferase, partial [Mycobacterium sp.]